MHYSRHIIKKYRKKYTELSKRLYYIQQGQNYILFLEHKLENAFSRFKIYSELNIETHLRHQIVDYCNFIQKEIKQVKIDIQAQEYLITAIVISFHAKK